jgi:hypothetical protein
MSRVFRFVVSMLCLVSGTAGATGEFQIGVYYFGGWKDNQVGSAYAQPWEKIKTYPEREPLLGWYAEGELPVMARQLEWMHEYGIDFLVFNWFWGGDDKVVLDHALNAYLRTADKRGVKFALQWSNHTKYKWSKVQFERLFRFWAQRYLTRPDYHRLDGKPVIFVFSADTLNKNVEHIGMTSAQFNAWADEVVRANGADGLRIIGGVSGGQRSFDYSEKSGYAGFSAYNFHGPAVMPYVPYRLMNVSHSYAELDAGYRDQWNWMLKNASGTYVVPMTSGWDKRPWGGSRDPLHDNSLSNPDEFEAHLRAARTVMQAASQKTQRMGVVCCWNEFGEGSFIEPTKAGGFSYLERIRSVFGSSSK